jgi:hypothetical protein
MEGVVVFLRLCLGVNVDVCSDVTIVVVVVYFLLPMFGFGETGKGMLSILVLPGFFFIWLVFP